MCAAPTSPTATTIATDGLRYAGISNPNTTQINTAETWLEVVKNDLYRKEKRLSSLYTQAVLVLDIGRWRYSMPTDYLKNLSLVIASGSITGTADAGSASSITLPTGSTVITGQEILITSNTGRGSMSQVTSFSSQVAGVEPDFQNAPDNTSGFMVIDSYREVEARAIRMLDQYNAPTVKGKPLECYVTKDNNDGEIIVKPPPDAVYGLVQRYYADLMEVDLTGTLMATLYKKWRKLFTQYVVYRQFQEDDDTRDREALALYNAMLMETVLSEISSLGEDEIKIEVIR